MQVEEGLFEKRKRDEREREGTTEVRGINILQVRNERIIGHDNSCYS